MQANVKQLVNFVVRHHTELAKWDRALLRQWMSFHVQEGFVLAISDGVRIAGLTVVRPVMKPQDGEHGWTFDYEGPCLYIACLIASSNEALRALAVCIHERFGFRPAVAWNHKRTRKLMCHSSILVARRIFKMQEV